MKLKLPLKRKHERGQAIVMVAGTLIGLVAILGLMIDVGLLFIESSQMKRAVDAAAVAASLEFRQGVNLSQKKNTPELFNAAQEFILLNEGDIYDLETFICDPSQVGDADYEHDDLCSGTADESDDRKLVRVRAVKDVEFSFLPVLGIDGTTISSEAVGEAASVDVVLVIDASQSMADQTDAEDYAAGVYSANTGNPKSFWYALTNQQKQEYINDFFTAGQLSDYEFYASGFTGLGDDPSVCNAADNCEPFKTIKDLAADFVDKLLFPYDRVSVVTFDRIPHINTTGNGWENNITQVKNTISALNVYQPEVCEPPNPVVGTCLQYSPNPTSPTSLSIACMHPANNGGDFTSCTSSNIGGGLEVANYQFTRDIREEALWVVIVLAGGPANAISPNDAHPAGYCSSAYWDSPLCRDDKANERHASTSALYDGDDFARDQADAIVGEGQGAVIYAIGYGEKVKNDTRHRSGSYDPDIAEKLLEYVAEEAGTPNLGVYYYAENLTVLQEVFRQIAENIATKIAQ